MTPISMEKRGMSAKPETHYPTSATRDWSTGGDFGCLTVESALRAADAVLGNRAESVWIVDRAGNLILPADQSGFQASPSHSAPGVR
jgi:hypothetical protein